MYMLTEPFVSAELEYRRERSKGVRSRSWRSAPARRARTSRAWSLRHRSVTGH
jgi:hypothetical protein